eukprot:4136914-Prymnesium_polylepis.1
MSCRSEPESCLCAAAVARRARVGRGGQGGGGGRAAALEAAGGDGDVPAKQLHEGALRGDGAGREERLLHAGGRAQGWPSAATSP